MKDNHMFSPELKSQFRAPPPGSCRGFISFPPWVKVSCFFSVHQRETTAWYLCLLVLWVGWDGVGCSRLQAWQNTVRNTLLKDGWAPGEGMQRVLPEQITPRVLKHGHWMCKGRCLSGFLLCWHLLVMSGSGSRTSGSWWYQWLSLQVGEQFFRSSSGHGRLCNLSIPVSTYLSHPIHINPLINLLIPPSLHHPFLQPFTCVFIHHSSIQAFLSPPTHPSNHLPISVYVYIPPFFYHPPTNTPYIPMPSPTHHGSVDPSIHLLWTAFGEPSFPVKAR